MSAPSKDPLGVQDYATQPDVEFSLEYTPSPAAIAVTTPLPDDSSAPPSPRPSFARAMSMKRLETLSKLRSKRKKYERAIPGSRTPSRAPSEAPSRALSPPPSQAKTRSKVDWISDYRARVEEGTNAKPSGNGGTIDLARNAMATIEETAELGENPDFVETLNSMWGTMTDDHIIKQISEEGNLIKVLSSADQTAEVWVHDVLTQTAGAINSLLHLLYASLRREKHLMAHAVVNQTKMSQLLEDIKQQQANHDERLSISHDTLTKQMYDLTSIVATNHTLYKDNFTCLFSAVVDNSGVIAESMGEKIVFTNPEGNEMDVDKIDLTNLVELGKFDPPLWHAPYGRIV